MAGLSMLYGFSMCVRRRTYADARYAWIYEKCSYDVDVSNKCVSRARMKYGRQTSVFFLCEIDFNEFWEGVNRMYVKNWAGYQKLLEVALM